MFGLKGFALCDVVGCNSREEVELGLSLNSMLYMAAEDVLPEGWELQGVKIVCADCVANLAKNFKRSRFHVVSQETVLELEGAVTMEELPVTFDKVVPTLTEKKT